MAYLIDIDSDFVGYWSIVASTYNSGDFEMYVDHFEKLACQEVFSKSMYKDVVADATQDKYTDLLDNGFKEYLLGYIYFGYMRDNFENTTVGAMQVNASNSTGVGNSYNASISISRFNAGVLQFNDYTLEFLEDNGVISEEVISISETGGVSTLTLESTKYLKDGDKVCIGLDEFTVSNVTSTTIDITTTTDYTGQVVTWYPFGDEYTETKLNAII